MNDEYLDPHATVRLLNEFHRDDPYALHVLVALRAPCGPRLAGHPTVQVGPNVGGPGGGSVVGLLGIVNGLCGVRADGTGHVAATYEDGRLTGFAVRE